MATGYFPRRRVRPGYLACKMCDRDLPEEEFRPTPRRYGDQVRVYRFSYCRACESAYHGQLDEAVAEVARLLGLVKKSDMEARG